MRKIKLNTIAKNSLHRYATIIAHGWNGYLEVFSLPQAVENSWQFLPL